MEVLYFLYSGTGFTFNILANKTLYRFNLVSMMHIKHLNDIWYTDPTNDERSQLHIDFTLEINIFTIYTSGL